MPLIRSYAIWNNKGGVGKSTITFHLAARIAELRPDINVLVVDLCPQANASMMLLGGGTQGEETVFDLCTFDRPETIVGYISEVLDGGARAALPDPYDFIQRVAEHNNHLTDNLYLLSGDGNLELMSPLITREAERQGLTPNSNPWLWVHRIVRSLIESIANNGDKEWLVFIDTNPSFSIYTELAVSAADRLITPVNADDSSRVATNAMFILLHGHNPPHRIYGAWTYATRAATSGLVIPQIHLVVGNRLTQHQGAAAAFSALSDATADTLYAAYRNHPNYFTPRAQPATNIQQFRDAYSIPLRDFNTAGVAAAHRGLRLSQMSGGNIQVYGTSVQLNRARIDECIEAIDQVAALID